MGLTSIWLLRLVRRALGFGVVGLAASVVLATSGSAARVVAQQPAIGHVFVIVLENQGYAGTFGDPSADPYLAETLPSQGALLTRYYAIGHESNDNYGGSSSGMYR